LDRAQVQDLSQLQFDIGFKDSNSS